MSRRAVVIIITTAVAAAALAVLATAATSAQGNKQSVVPPNSVGTQQVINGSLRAVDFKPGQLPRGPKGDRGPQGPQGAVGPSGVMKTTRLAVGGTEAGVQDNFSPTDTTLHERMTLGAFTKNSPGTSIRVSWQAPLWITGTGNQTCWFQLRIDGQPGIGGNAVLWLGPRDTFDADAINSTADFTGLPSGAHSIGVWVRGVGNPSSCYINPGNFAMTVLVDEMP